jgi:hypothetical protein
MKEKKKKTKHTFTLIEVLIAFALTTAACFFLLEFEESYIKNTRASIKKVEKERLIQEAYVLLLQNLYTNEIPWKVIEDNKSYLYPLSENNWEAEAFFTPKPTKFDDPITQEFLDAKITLKLFYKGEEQCTEPEIRLCLKKEERTHVQAPEA